MRWMEEFELKHMEFVRCIRSFAYTSQAWETLSDSEDIRPGYPEFARRQSNFYRELYADASLLFEKYGEERFVRPKASLIDAIQDFREQELSWFRELASPEPARTA
jgi:hypothetical protein